MWSPISPAFSNNRTRKSSFPASFASCFNRIAAAKPAGPSSHAIRTTPYQQWGATRSRRHTTTHDTDIHLVRFPLNMGRIECVPFFPGFPAQCRGERPGLARNMAGNELPSNCLPPPGWRSLRGVAAARHTGEAILPGPARGWKHLPSQEREKRRFRSHCMPVCPEEAQSMTLQVQFLSASPLKPNERRKVGAKGRRKPKRRMAANNADADGNTLSREAAKTPCPSTSSSLHDATATLSSPTSCGWSLSVHHKFPWLRLLVISYYCSKLKARKTERTTNCRRKVDTT